MPEPKKTLPQQLAEFTAYVEGLEDALTTCVHELATLAPRLPEQYAKNVRAAREKGSAALKAKVRNV